MAEPDVLTPFKLFVGQVPHPPLAALCASVSAAALDTRVNKPAALLNNSQLRRCR